MRLMITCGGCKVALFYICSLSMVQSVKTPRLPTISRESLAKLCVYDIPPV